MRVILDRLFLTIIAFITICELYGFVVDNAGCYPIGGIYCFCILWRFSDESNKESFQCKGFGIYVTWTWWLT